MGFIKFSIFSVNHKLTVTQRGTYSLSISHAAKCDGLILTDKKKIGAFLIYLFVALMKSGAFLTIRDSFSI